MSLEKSSVLILCLTALVLVALSPTCVARLDTRRLRHGKQSPTKNFTVPTSHQTNYDQIYTKWTPWRKCSSRCKQVRSRLCKSPQHCGANVLREVRRCRGNRCSNKPTIVADGERLKERDSDFRVLYHLQHFVYSEWTSWSPCTRSCRTHRLKTCEMALVCGNGLIQEDALCYAKGSVCEKLYNKKRKRRRGDKMKDEKKKRRENDESNSEGGDDNGIQNSNRTIHQINSCGIPEVEDERSLRIIGGQDALKDKWPWQVVVMDRHKNPFCGGTVLSSEWILTAAHCVQKRRNLRIRAGEHDLVKQEGTEQEIRIGNSYIHPKYDAHTVNNDIALLHLRHPLRINRHVKPVCLPSPRESLSLHSSATILGWGKRRNAAMYGSDVLQQAVVPVIDLDECRAVYKDYYISNNMLCAGYKMGGVDSCEGDSGGPLLYLQEGKWIIHGVTSFGEGCGRKGKYGIYAKVANFVKWIKKIMAIHSKSRNANDYLLILH